MIFSLKKIIQSLILLALLFSLTTGHTFANDDICPKNKTLEQCYADLSKQMAELDKQAKATTQSLSKEKYNQLSLNQQIDYINGKIQESELEIKKIEIEIEAKNVEIRMLERDLEETQDKIVSVKQETSKLETSISKRLANSYKYSFMNTLELLVKSQDFDILLRKMKYLVDTRKSDKELLISMQNKNFVLTAEEQILGKTKLNLEKIRIDVENKKTDLFNQKENLAAQQSEQTRLLAVSKKNEEAHKATLTEIETAQNQVTQQITAIIQQIYARGGIEFRDIEVKKGFPIGSQGYTGFTFGAHLHLEIYNSANQRFNPFPAGYFSGGSLWSPVGAGIYHAPLDGGVLTQTFWSNHLAIDLQSTTHGDQSGGKYYGSEIRCLGRVRPAGNYNTRGTGALVRAIADGYVSKEYTDVCGGKYVILKHLDGNSSLYLHLK